MEKVVPGFILKLWRMINDPRTNDLITWSDEGKSFIILDPIKFSSQLSKYFKHNNLSSFIRQLNMYGFKKVATIDNEDLHFHHPDFLRDHQERLELIKRKLPQKIESIDMKNVIKNITDIEGKQKDVTKALADIRRENEMLWAELHDLRQKHQQQQLYITSLMKLVFNAMEQKHIIKPTLQVHRTSPLMIENINQVPNSGDLLVQQHQQQHQQQQQQQQHQQQAQVQVINQPELGILCEQAILPNQEMLPVPDINIITGPTTPASTGLDVQMSNINDQHQQIQLLEEKIDDHDEQIDNLTNMFGEFDGKYDDIFLTN